MRFTYILALSLAALTMAGCGSKNRQATPQSGTDADSVAVDSVEADVAPAFLPDTAYASVDELKYVVEVVDSSIDPILNSTVDPYDNVPGGLAFRKGQRRDADFGGTVKGNPTKVVVDWTFNTPMKGRWGGGSGWNGQPVYINWPDSCIASFKQAGVVNENFGPQEIMVGSLYGSVYFINFETGKASRKAIDMVNPIKGSISLDPSLNGNLYVGQGIAERRPFGAYVIDLYKHEVTHFHKEDPKAYRQWGAYDSSPVRQGQFLFRPGENGSFYKFLILDGDLKLQSVMRYRSGSIPLGLEASVGIYSNYGYIADNGGNVICVNLNTMKPVWRYFIGDDTDHSLIVEVENGHPYVYTGCEVDKQGVNGIARYVKLDGLNGREVWKQDIQARRSDQGSKHFDGGFYATALPGKGDCADLIFANCVLNTKGQNGQFMAFKRKTGEIVYTTPLKYYAWSSPVGFLNEKGEQTVFAADCSGNVYLIKGKTGEIIFTEHIGDNFESSPVVSGNSLVVGSRGNRIIKMSIQ